MKSVLIKICSTEIRLPHLLSPVFEYDFRRIPFPAIFPSFNSMLKESRVVAAWKIPSKSYHYSQGNFKFVTSKNQQNAFPKIHIKKYYVTRLYFLKDHFYNVKKVGDW